MVHITKGIKNKKVYKDTGINSRGGTKGRREERKGK
jgi:hypothetical protein